ncbi:MAG: sialate O-acetylesterase [Pirellulaceae bacterium]|nr:sialate O-acetylesterase [Pirellulaceae bacterium]
MAYFGSVIFLLSLTLALVNPVSTHASDDPIKVFILAGQSNMEGYGMLPSLEYLGRDQTFGHLLKELKRKDGTWAVRDDVTVCWKKNANQRFHGPLSVEWGALPGQSIGPELMFGTLMGQRYQQQVLLIKTAWGGKSVWCDFRSPSAGKMTWDERRILKRDNWLQPGKFYQQMVSDIRQCLGELEEVVPRYQGQGYDLVGMVWLQGWNDFSEWHLQLDGRRVGLGLIERYPHNLAAMFRDLRRDLAAPRLPIVIGELGVGGLEMNNRAKNPEDEEAVAMVRFRQAQRAVVMDPKLRNVSFVPTAQFWDARLQELRLQADAYWDEKQRLRIEDTDENVLPTKRLNDEYWSRGGHWSCHYNGSAATYALIGQAFANAFQHPD